MKSEPSKEVARITSVETSVERTGHTADDDVDVLALAAEAALNLLADAIVRGRADYDTVVQGLKKARIDEALGRVFEGASERVMQDADDPYDFDVRLHADNLSGAAGTARRIFEWL